jgi:hypothetical protein
MFNEQQKQECLAWCRENPGNRLAELVRLLGLDDGSVITSSSPAAVEAGQELDGKPNGPAGGETAPGDPGGIPMNRIDGLD